MKKKNMLIVGLCCFLGLITIATFISIQSQPAISGTITYNGRPSHDIDVSLCNDNVTLQTVRTDGAGHYSFDAIGNATRLSAHMGGLLIYEIGPGISPGIYDHNVKGPRT